MKVVFCSNYMNHHQLYLAKAFIDMGVEYYFVATKKIMPERIKLGYRDMNDEYDFIIKLYEGEDAVNKAKRLIKDADLVIAGMFPMKMLRSRILANKPVFLYSERFFKTNNGNVNQFLTFKKRLGNLVHRKYLDIFNVHMLCASAYTAYDLHLLGDMKNRCYKWGYFPYVNEYDIESLISKRRDHKRVQLLWVGRMIDWKHPEVVINLAKRLVADGVDFDINIIGTGDMENTLKNEISGLNLENNVHLLGSMSTEEVREHMLDSDIFLFTSDFNEGWGAVLNEAMNSGISVVASHAIGAVPFLIEDGKNGYIYTLGKEDEMYSIVRHLIDSREDRERVSRSAYETITCEWNPKCAVKKLIQLYDNIVNKAGICIPSGVCSKAEVIENNWRE